MTNTTTANVTIFGAEHPWERAGLGQAPYKFLGASREVYQAIPGDPNCPLQPAGSCDFCGQAIWDQCRFESADGKRFKVGCDCAGRANEGGKKLSAWQREHDRQVRAARKARKVDAATAAHAELLARCESLVQRVCEMPVPVGAKAHNIYLAARSIVHSIKAGKSPSDKQIAWLERATEAV